MVALLLATGCGDDSPRPGISGPPLTSTSLPPGTGTPDTTSSLPTWLRAVQPGPGAPSSAAAFVAVDFPLLTRGDELRLLVDGVDVTSQSFQPQPTGPTGPGTITPFPGPGSLRYEPRSLPAPLVALPPGEHFAQVDLVRRVAFGESVNVVDSFTWRFSVL